MFHSPFFLFFFYSLLRTKMEIKIQKWSGRLGNNLIQLKNVIQIALYDTRRIHAISFPSHSYFTKTHLRFVDRKSTRQYITDENEFFYSDRIRDIDQKCFYMNVPETQRLLQSIFIIQGVPSLPKDHLVIHIRSGDMFSAAPHPEYIPPPLSFYTDIIGNNRTFRQLYLITEDTKNPVIHCLLEKYPSIRFTLQDLSDDIRLLLSAPNVIMSYGSFVPALLSLSNNIRVLHKPSYVKEGLMISNFSVNVVNYNVQPYHALVHPWKNTPKQRDILLRYPHLDPIPLQSDSVAHRSYPIYIMIIGVWLIGVVHVLYWHIGILKTKIV